MKDSVSALALLFVFGFLFAQSYAAAPDLVCGGFYGPQVGYAGDTLTAAYYIGNQNGTAPSNISVAYLFIDGSFWGSDYVPSIAGNCQDPSNITACIAGPYYASVTCPSYEHNYNITVCADATNTNSESNENNNCCTSFRYCLGGNGTNNTTNQPPVVTLTYPWNGANPVPWNPQEPYVTLWWNLTDDRTAGEMFCDAYTKAPLESAFSLRAANISVWNNSVGWYTYATGANGTYYWYVKCRDGEGAVGASATWSFTTRRSTPQNASVPVVALQSPHDNAMYPSEQNVTLLWYVSDLDSPVLSSCLVQLSTNGGAFTTLAQLYDVRSGTFNRNTFFARAGVYQWKVTCTDPTHLSGSDGPRVFTVSRPPANNTAPVVVLNSPANGQVFPRLARLANLTWTATDDTARAMGCYVYVKMPRSPRFIPLGRRGAANNTATSLPCPLPVSGTYSWYVACSDTRLTGTSATWSFVKSS